MIDSKNSHMVIERHLFLDLEDTVITTVEDGWSTAQVINARAVRDFISKFDPHYVHVFSFAIYHAQDVAEFNRYVRPYIEANLGIKIVNVPTLDDDIVSECCNSMNIHKSTVTRRDAIDFWGKQEAFRLYARSLFGKPLEGVQTNIVLLDDMVTEETFSFPKIRLDGQILNIADIC